jgi:hypothetical protein
VGDPGLRQFGEVRVEVQRSTVEPCDRSNADPEEAIIELLRMLASSIRRLRRPALPNPPQTSTRHAATAKLHVRTEPALQA